MKGIEKSVCCRQTFAKHLNCSLATVDRANTELQRAGLITKMEYQFEHEGLIYIFYRLNPLSEWTLPSRKETSEKPNSNGALDETHASA